MWFENIRLMCVRERERREKRVTRHSRMTLDREVKILWNGIASLNKVTSREKQLQF